MKETILNDNEFAIVLDNGTIIIANINAVPNIIKMFNNLMEKKETSVTETTDTPVNKSSVTDVKPVNETENCELDFPETNYVGSRSSDNRNACLKAFAAGQGKLVISSEGKVFLSLAAAEEYYGLSIGFMSNYIRTHKGSGVDCGFNSRYLHETMPCLVRILRKWTNGDSNDNTRMNPLAGMYNASIIKYDLNAFCCFSFVLKGKNGPMHGPWQTDRACKDSGKDIAFMVFDNKQYMHDTNPEVELHYESNPWNYKEFLPNKKFLFCSAAQKVFTYALPGISWEFLYKGMDKQLKIGERIEKFFGKPAPLWYQKQCFNEIISYLKNKYNV